MTINDCTKAELILVVRMLKANFVTNGDYYLTRALNEIMEQRANKFLDESERLGKEADKMRQRYLEVMRPYWGYSLEEVPLDVLASARSYLHRADVLERKSTEASKKVDMLWEN